MHQSASETAASGQDTPRHNMKVQRLHRSQMTKDIKDITLPPSHNPTFTTKYIQFTEQKHQHHCFISPLFQRDQFIACLQSTHILSTRLAILYTNCARIASTYRHGFSEQQRQSETSGLVLSFYPSRRTSREIR